MSALRSFMTMVSIGAVLTCGLAGCKATEENSPGGESSPEQAVVADHDSGQAANAFEDIPGAGQLVDSAVVRALQPLGLTFRTCYWPEPESDGSKSIPVGQVSKNVLDTAATWIRRIVNSSVLPPDIEHRFVPFTRQEQMVFPTSIDYLAVRYRYNGNEVQILESGDGVALLWIPSADPSTKISPDAYVEDEVRKLLNVPWDRVAETQTLLGEGVPLDDDRKLTYGTIHFTDNDLKNGLVWWYWISFWTDGRMVYLAVPEVDIRELSPTSSPGRPKPRF